MPHSAPSGRTASAPAPAPLSPPAPGRRWWYVAIVVTAFLTLIGAAGFRAVPSVYMEPLGAEFGWSHGQIGFAMSINLLLFGLLSPFAAACMDRFGIRRVVAVALCSVAAGSGLSVFMSEVWHLWLLWGVVIGAGTGAMSMAFVATVANRWFIVRRGFVSGILTAASAAGQLVFLPLVAHLVGAFGWRLPSLVVSAAALLVLPIAVGLLRDHPADVGLTPLGATRDNPGPLRPVRSGSAARRAVDSLGGAICTRTFWMLALGFAVCGASTNGLIGTHFVPAAHDHGMPATTAASLLALVGIFDIAGTVLSGWLTDKIDPRILLFVYYTLRGGSLLLLPALLGPEVHPPLWAFIIFYGLDWVATVPPTVALCVEKFGSAGAVVFGWVFASHQIGAAVAAFGAGWIRDTFGAYDLAWLVAGSLCFLAAVFSVLVRRHTAGRTPVSA